MPYGSGRVVGQALVRATPWQRYLIGAAMVAGGVVLVVLGHLAGGLLAVAGVLVLSRMVRYRLRRRQQMTGSAPGTGAP
jgi:hypothetical protein